jgi:hypothetical protein
MCDGENQRRHCVAHTLCSTHCVAHIVRLCSTLTHIAYVELQQLTEHRRHYPKLDTERYHFNYILDHQNDDGNYTGLHEEAQKKTSLKICFIS